MGSEAVLFRRYEKKFMINEDLFDKLTPRLEGYMVPDRYAYSTIVNIYYDTPDFLLARLSNEKPLYKEKLRMRAYGVPGPDDPVFVEIKKKYEDVVYKRRISMTRDEGEAYLSGAAPPPEPSQISREIDFCLQRYRGIGPAMFISYDRYSLADPEGGPVRITFDRNITWRREDLHLGSGIYGRKLLQPGQVLMEVKVPEAYPLWLVKIFYDLGIWGVSFSKYGKIYETLASEGLHRVS